MENLRSRTLAKRGEAGILKLDSSGQDVGRARSTETSDLIDSPALAGLSDNYNGHV